MSLILSVLRAMSWKFSSLIEEAFRHTAMGYEAYRDAVDYELSRSQRVAVSAVSVGRLRAPVLRHARPVRCGQARNAKLHILVAGEFTANAPSLLPKNPSGC